jgi:hypothetical protein
MDDLVLEDEASRLLVQIGRSIESWILDDAKQRAQGRTKRTSGPVRIDAVDIQSSLSELLSQGVGALEEIRDGTDVVSRRAS